MTTEAPTRQIQDMFDDSVDNATHDVIGRFQWMGLPEGDQMSDLMVQINDAIAAVMRDWI